MASHVALHHQQRVSAEEYTGVLSSWKSVFGSISVRVCLVRSVSHHAFTFNTFFCSCLYSEYNFSGYCALLSNFTHLLPLLLLLDLFFVFHPTYHQLRSLLHVGTNFFIIVFFYNLIRYTLPIVIVIYILWTYNAKLEGSVEFSSRMTFSFMMLLGIVVYFQLFCANKEYCVNVEISQLLL